MAMRERRLGRIRFFRLANADGDAANIKRSGDSQIPGDWREHLKGQRERKQENVKPCAAHQGFLNVTATRDFQAKAKF